MPSDHRKNYRVLVKVMLYLLCHNVVTVEHSKNYTSSRIIHVAFVLHMTHRDMSWFQIFKNTPYNLTNDAPSLFVETSCLPSGVLLRDKRDKINNKAFRGSDAFNGQLMRFWVIPVNLFDVSIYLIANIIHLVHDLVVEACGTIIPFVPRGHRWENISVIQSTGTSLPKD